MSADPVGPDYHNALDNLLTLWGYERTMRAGSQLKVMKSGVDGSGFTGFTFWTIQTWINNIRTHDEYLAGRGRPVNMPWAKE